MSANTIFSPTSALSWKSIFAGTLAALLAYVALISLGIAVGGLSTRGADATGFGIWAGIWFVLANMISLFAGAYFAGRTANFLTRNIAWAQGIVISAIFFAVVAMQATTFFGFASQGLSNLAGTLQSGVKDFAGTSEVQQTLSGALGQVNLKSDPDVVAQGLAARLIRGDTESAKNYFAYQTGMSRAEADSKIASAIQTFQDKFASAKLAAAHAVSTAAWLVLAVLVLSTLTAMWGGGVAAKQSSGGPSTEQKSRSGMFPPQPLTT